MLSEEVVCGCLPNKNRFFIESKRISISIRRFHDCILEESGKEEYQKTFLSWMNPKPDNQKEMRKVFGNLEKGLWVDLEDINLDPNQPFYILCLAPNAARLSVRFFYQNSFGTIIKNISRHYQRMEIVKPSWVENEYLGVKKMLDETVNQKSKDKTPVPNMASMVLRAILEDSRYPESLYTDTLIRIRAV